MRCHRPSVAFRGSRQIMALVRQGELNSMENRLSVIAHRRAFLRTQPNNDKLLRSAHGMPCFNARSTQPGVPNRCELGARKTLNQVPVKKERSTKAQRPFPAPRTPKSRPKCVTCSDGRPLQVATLASLLLSVSQARLPLASLPAVFTSMHWRITRFHIS